MKDFSYSIAPPPAPAQGEFHLANIPPFPYSEVSLKSCFFYGTYNDKLVPFVLSLPKALVFVCPPLLPPPEDRNLSLICLYIPVNPGQCPVPGSGRCSMNI